MGQLRPFFSYYGAKWTLAPKYPAPKYPRIIEPFAGSACYSLLWWDREIILIDAYKVVADLWKYLINADPNRIASLPDLGDKTVDDFDLCPEEKSLIGFWCNVASSHPCKSMSKWAQSATSQLFWGERVRQRIIEQLPAIRHWTAYHSEFNRGWTGIEATWFIDPPYQVAGKHYAQSVQDFQDLSLAVQELSGQVIVCEAEGADWLPFVPFRSVNARTKPGVRPISKEVIWCRG
jgi:hypothetical protein